MKKGLILSLFVALAMFIAGCGDDYAAIDSAVIKNPTGIVTVTRPGLDALIAEFAPDAKTDTSFKAFVEAFEALKIDKVVFSWAGNNFDKRLIVVEIGKKTSVKELIDILRDIDAQREMEIAAVSDKAFVISTYPGYRFCLEGNGHTLLIGRDEDLSPVLEDIKAMKPFVLPKEISKLLDDDEHTTITGIGLNIEALASANDDWKVPGLKDLTGIVFQETVKNKEAKASFKFVFLNVERAVDGQKILEAKRNEGETLKQKGKIVTLSGATAKETVLVAPVRKAIVHAHELVSEIACTNNLKYLGRIAQQYLAQHPEGLPTADTLYAKLNMNIGNESVFSCHATKTPFVYFGSGCKKSDFTNPAKTVLFADKELHDGTITICFADGHVASFEGKSLDDVIAVNGFLKPVAK